jgi:hypothetical protein
MLQEVHKTYPVFIVAHKHDALLDEMNLPYHIRENRGLEFGAYDWYLQNRWQGGPVLFQHDDVRIKDISAYRQISEIQADQTYIFGDEYTVKRNRGIHGRAFYCSPAILKLIKEDGGIWFDHGNKGNVLNLHPGPDEGMDFNAGICHFRDQMIEYKEKGYDTGGHKIILSFSTGERGKFRQEVL